MSRKSNVLAVLLLLLASLAARAWSDLGHELVGALAESELTPAAKAEIAELLRGEADPTLAGVAAWADHLRRLDPERFKATSRWHYGNTPAGICTFDAARDCADGQCLVAAIETQRRLLADRAQPIEVRRDALKFIVHFIGDVHQPLHASNRADLGGNTFQVSLRTPIEPEAYARAQYVNGVMGTNLHSIWDFFIIASAGLDRSAYVAKLGVAPMPALATESLEAAAWSAESCALIDGLKLYPRKHKMTHKYLDQNRPRAEQRIRLAGHRLAMVLNAALPPTTAAGAAPAG